MAVREAAAPVVAPARGLTPLFEFSKYFAASCIALATDGALLAFSSQVGLPYALGAGIGFVAGLIIAYILSIAWVFEARAVANACTEFVAFATIGVAGLGLTEVILWCAIDRLGWHLGVAKLCSAAVVFLFNFFVRKALLFRSRYS